VCAAVPKSRPPKQHTDPGVEAKTVFEGVSIDRNPIFANFVRAAANTTMSESTK